MNPLFSQYDKAPPQRRISRQGSGQVFCGKRRPTTAERLHGGTYIDGYGLQAFAEENGGGGGGSGGGGMSLLGTLGTESRSSPPSFLQGLQPPRSRIQTPMPLRMRDVRSRQALTRGLGSRKYAFDTGITDSSQHGQPPVMLRTVSRRASTNSRENEPGLIPRRRARGGSHPDLMQPQGTLHSGHSASHTQGGYMGGMDTAAQSRLGSSHGGVSGSLTGLGAQKPGTANRWQLPEITGRGEGPPAAISYVPTKRGKSRHHHHSSTTDLQPLLAAQEPEVVCVSGEACGVCTIKGLKPGNPNWQNQDNFVLAEGMGAGGDVHVFGVLDGHGEVGHLVSARCREQLPCLLSQADFDLSRACRFMQQDLMDCGQMDVQCSGATCVLAVLRANGSLKVANLGDSRCVLGRMQKGTMVAVPLTRDHKPDRPDEHQRIVAAGGQVGCRQVIVSQRAGSHPVTLPMGPPRIWYQCRGEIMGLAMSRSLGDAVVHTVGGSFDPEITDVDITEADQFLVLASDGIWDVVDNNQAVQIVHSYASRSPDWDPKEAANILGRFARHRWQSVSSMVDDITCVVVKLSCIRLSYQPSD